MKKIILITILLFFVSFVSNHIYAQDIANNIPGLTCGVAGDVTGKDKCCNISSANVSGCSNDGNDLTNAISNILRTGSELLLGKDNFILKVVDKKDESCQKITDFINQTTTGENACISGSPSSSDFTNTSCKCIDVKATNPNQAMIDMCSKYLTGTINVRELSSCFSCAGNDGMWTGMGCLSLDISTLISGFLLNTGIGVGGGLALLCIIYGTFMMQSSAGNPEKLKKAQEMITSCIMGLMLIIFSVFIMKLIGVNILRIPGFG